MNGRAAAFWLRPQIFMDLRQRDAVTAPGESPIGAWATPTSGRATARKTSRSLAVNSGRCLATAPHAGKRARAPAQSQTQGTTTRRPEKFKQQSRRPRRRCLDFSLLIGGTRNHATRRIFEGVAMAPE